MAIRSNAVMFYGVPVGYLYIAIFVALMILALYLLYKKKKNKMT